MDARSPLIRKSSKSIERSIGSREIWAGGTLVPPEQLGQAERKRPTPVRGGLLPNRRNPNPGIRRRGGAGRGASTFPERAELAGYAARHEPCRFRRQAPSSRSASWPPLNAVVLGKPGNPPPPSALPRDAPSPRSFRCWWPRSGTGTSDFTPASFARQDRGPRVVAGARAARRRTAPASRRGDVLHLRRRRSVRSSGATVAPFRVIVPHLLRREGYGFVDYASLERVFEETRFGYYDAIDQAQTKIWTDEANMHAVDPVLRRVAATR